MDIKDFYLKNVDESEYHYRFYDSIKNVNQIYNVFDGYQEVYDYQFEVYDAEEAIDKFRELCQPEIKYYDNEKKCWFYLITYYLSKIGYEIKEFPKVLARPPIEPEDFSYGEIRNYIISKGEDDNGTVRYASRRILVASLQFELKANHIEINDYINQKFVEISNRHASFNNMSIDEKLAEIANLIENLLKRNGSFVNLDYSKVCIGFITDEMIKEYRNKMHCFRHASENAIEERKNYSNEQKEFLVDYGLTIVKAIYSLVN